MAEYQTRQELEAEWSELPDEIRWRSERLGKLPQNHLNWETSNFLKYNGCYWDGREIPQSKLQKSRRRN